MDEYMIYGFAAPESALVNWGYRVALTQGRRPSATPSENVKAAMAEPARRAPGLHARLVLAYFLPDETRSPERDYAIALASNDGRDGLPNAPPPEDSETLERLKEVLGIEADKLAWYYADRTAETVPRRI